VVGPATAVATTASRSGVNRQAGVDLFAMTPGPESALRRQGLSAIADDDVLHRLALWLADVSAEAASAPKAPEASPTPIRVAQGPRVAEPPR
jgi:hypothetical protein